jgi:ABC transport system ATP-binding/permease protein
LSFTERKRMNDLPAIIAKLEAEIAKLEELLDSPDLFTKEPVKFRKGSEMLADRQAQLSAAEEEWLTLADRA